MESCEKSSECFCKHSRETRVLGPQFLQNGELFLECVYLLPSSVEDRNEFNSFSNLDYLVLLAAFIQLNFYACIEKCGFALYVLSL